MNFLTKQERKAIPAEREMRKEERSERLSRERNVEHDHKS
jgi:hypothetical protein